MSSETRLRARVARLEAVQEVVLTIDRLSAASRELIPFVAKVHEQLARLMYVANFYVALLSPDRQHIRYVYSVDEKDPTEDPLQYFALSTPEESPTAWVIMHAQPLVMTAEEDAARAAAGNNWGRGSRAEHWVGMPLLSNDGVALGGMVMQSYEPGRIYTAEDIALFGVLANHVANAVERLQATERLERAVSERTAQLGLEIEERKRAAALQRALYQIAALSTSELSMADLYQHVHGIIDSLLYAKNFAIGLVHEEAREFSVVYFVDEKDPPFPEGTRFPVGHGISSFVLRTRQAQLIDQARRQRLLEQGEIRVSIGNRGFASWMGAPMISADYLYGLIFVQSYDPAIIYNEADLALLSFVASHVANAIARRRADMEMRETNQLLAEQKRMAEQNNQELSDALRALRVAQTELVRQEKLASLGELVAGVAHEINTPLGICVTANSHLAEETRLIQESLELGSLNERELRQYFSEVNEVVRILTTNTQRAAALVRSFKQVAVDQSSGEARQFLLKQYLDEIVLSLRPRLKHSGHHVLINCPAGLQLYSYPGALSQIISNLIMNSLVHGFEHVKNGEIRITAYSENDDVILHFADNGCGMDSATLKKLFDPFYTSKRGQGGSGLGAHIVYNLVTGALAGSIEVHSGSNEGAESGAGLHYKIRFPLERKKTSDISQENAG